MAADNNQTNSPSNPIGSASDTSQQDWLELDQQGLGGETLKAKQWTTKRRVVDSSQHVGNIHTGTEEAVDLDKNGALTEETLQNQGVQEGNTSAEIESSNLNFQTSANAEPSTEIFTQDAGQDSSQTTETTHQNVEQQSVIQGAGDDSLVFEKHFETDSDDRPSQSDQSKFSGTQQTTPPQPATELAGESSPEPVSTTAATPSPATPAPSTPTPSTIPQPLPEEETEEEVKIIPVESSASAPTLNAEDSHGLEDTAIAIELSSSLTDTDGSESLTVTIGGVPVGATLSAGQNLGNGTWKLTSDELTDLTLSPPTNSDEDFSLTITATSTESHGGATNSVSEVIDVFLEAVNDNPIAAADIYQNTELLNSENPGNLTDGAPSGTRVIGIYAQGSDENLLDGKDELLTLNDHNYFEHNSLGHTGYNYMGGNNWFADNDISLSGLRGGIIAFEDGTQGIIDTSSNGVTRDRDGDGTIDYEENAYIYYNAYEALGDLETLEDRTLTISPETLLVNDSDVDSSSLSITDVANATNGTVALNEDGTITFEPDSNFSGEATFTYTVDDSQGGSSSTIVTLNIQAAVDKPEITVTTASGDEDSSIALNIDVALSDTDGSETLDQILVEGVPHDAILSAGQQNNDGSWTLNQEELEELTVTPGINNNQDFTLQISTTATESNGDEATTTIELPVTVNAVNDAPDAVNDRDNGILDSDNPGSQTNGAARGTRVTGLYSNGSDENLLDGKSELTTLSDHSYFEHGSLGHTGYNYMGGHDWFADNDINLSELRGGIITFEDGTQGIIDTSSNGVTRDRDGDGTIDYEENAYIYYNAYEGDGPLQTEEDTALTITQETLLANDTDIDGDILSITAVSEEVVDSDGKVVGTATQDDDGNIRFTPGDALDSLAEGEDKEVSFTYTVSDGQGGSDTATVSVTITGTDDAPVLLDDNADISEDQATPLTGNVLSNDSDIDKGSSLSVSSVAGITVFQDNFDDGNTNGWAEISYNERDTGNWQVVDGVIGERSNSAKGIIAHDMGENADSSNYEVTVDVHANTGRTGNNNVGITFGYEDNSNFYLIKWDDYSENYSEGSTHKDFKLIKVEDGRQTVIDQIDHAELPSDFALSVKVSDDGGIAVTIDGEEKLTAEDEHPAIHTIGLNTDDNDGGVSYDNVSVINNDVPVEDVTSIDGLYGTLTLNSDGSYSYELDDANNNVQTLHDGEQLTESFTVNVLENQSGKSGSEALNITINGTNDRPVAVDDSTIFTLQTVFEDTFNDGNADGWTEISYNETDTGNWQVVDGAIGERSNSAKGIMAHDMGDDSDSTNYEVTVDIHANAGDTYNNNVGITFGYEDNDNFYMVKWDDYSDNYSESSTHKDFKLIKVENGRETVIDQVDQAELSSDFNLSVNVSDDIGISIKVDGTEMLTAAEEHPAINTIGLNTDDNDSGISYDNVSVKVASDQIITTDEDTVLTIDADKLLANDTDVDGDTLSITAVSEDVVDTDGNVVGTATQDFEGNIVFTPGDTLSLLADGESKNVSFSYTVSDGQGGTDTATTTITVKGTDNDLIEEGAVVDSSLFTTGSDSVNLATADENYGDNKIYDALGGNDTITGGSNNDQIRGNAGNDTLNGEAGDDTFHVSGANDGYDNVSGGEGKDTILGSEGDDTIGIGSFNADNSVEVIDGGDGSNVIQGSTYANMDFSQTELKNIDEIRGGSGSNKITGTDQDDVIVGGRGNDTMDGGQGDDTFKVTGTDQGYDNVQGGEGEDTILGSEGDDTIGLGSFNADNSVEVIDGGEGSNVIQGSTYANMDFSQTELKNIDEIRGGSGSNKITGSSQDDVIVGGRGNDTMDGGQGDDTFKVSGTDQGYDNVQGGEGNDTIQGSEGDDTIGIGSFNTDNSVEVIDGGEGSNVIQGSTYANMDFSQTELKNIDEIRGGSGSNKITATSQDDVIVGGRGNDTMDGGQGDDTFKVTGTNQGYDNVQGGEGEDTLLGSEGDDTIGIGSFNADNSVEIIDGGEGSNVIQGSTYANMDFSQTELKNIDEIRGGSGSNKITATDQNDVIIGGRGNDTMDGGQGDDTFKVTGTNQGYDNVQGGEGEDTILGSEGDDTIGIGSFNADNSVEVIDGGEGSNVIQGSTYANMDFSQTELKNINEIRGGSGSNTVTGSVANDNILTGRGNDTIAGDSGDDLIDGGSGTDTVIFSGNETDYNIVKNSNGSFTVKDTKEGRDGDDTVTDVEQFAFADNTVAVGDLTLSSKLIDGAVEGVEYSTTSGLHGFTDDTGGFDFKDGDDVTFTIGGVTLGTATAEDVASGQTFLQDVADVDRTDLNDEYLENMATFLQSIDENSNAYDGIVVTKEIREALTDVTIDLQTATEEEVQAVVEKIGQSYVEEDAAMDHVQDMLVEHTDLTHEEFDEHIDDDLSESNNSVSASAAVTAEATDNAVQDFNETNSSDLSLNIPSLTLPGEEEEEKSSSEETETIQAEKQETTAQDQSEVPNDTNVDGQTQTDILADDDLSHSLPSTSLSNLFDEPAGAETSNSDQSNTSEDSNKQGSGTQEQATAQVQPVADDITSTTNAQEEEAVETTGEATTAGEASEEPGQEVSENKDDEIGLSTDDLSINLDNESKEETQATEGQEDSSLDRFVADDNAEQTEANGLDQFSANDDSAGTEEMASVDIIDNVVEAENADQIEDAGLSADDGIQEELPQESEQVDTNIG